MYQVLRALFIAHFAMRRSTPQAARRILWGMTRHPLRTLAAALLLLSPFALTGCIVAGGSSRGGWFIFPGGFGLILMILLVVFLLRRR